MDSRAPIEGWAACLAEFGWLEELSAAEVDAVAPLGYCHQIASGALIYSPEEKPKSVFLLQRGIVRIYRVSGRGDELTLGYVGPQEVFGELSGFCGFPRESHAIAVTPCQVCEMPQETFHRLLDSSPVIVLDMVAMISRRLKRIEGRLAGVVFRDTFARLCAILLELAEDFGRPEAGGILITVPLTQAEVATLIGSVRQTVNRMLRRLEEAGHLARQDGHFLVLDKRGLEEVTRLSA